MKYASICSSSQHWFMWQIFFSQEKKKIFGGFLYSVNSNSVSKFIFIYAKILCFRAFSKWVVKCSFDKVIGSMRILFEPGEMNFIKILDIGKKYIKGTSHELTHTNTRQTPRETPKS